MSKKNGNDQVSTENNNLTIEEHKKNLNIDAPVFAAVMQAKRWGSGKKVPEAVFKKAVKEFLGAPMDGVKTEAVTENITVSEAVQEGLKEGV